MSLVQMYSYDDETGEVVSYQIDEETGEPALQLNVPPPQATQSPTLPTACPRKKYTKFPKGITTKSKKFQSLKANIIAGSNPVSHRMLLIPTVLMIFPGFICICLSILELILHVRCHRKNKSLKDSNSFYQSPFHALTSTFCGVCREQEMAARVGQLQDQRRDRHDYLRGIAL